MSQTSTVRAWIKGNSGWLTPDHGPLTESLLMLAKTMDQELKDNGKVSGGVATSFRLTFKHLSELKTGTTKDDQDDDDDLLSPEGDD